MTLLAILDVFLAVSVACYYFISRIRIEKLWPGYSYDTLVPSRSLTRSQILLIVTEGRLVLSILVMLTLVLLLLLARAAERLTVPETIGSCVLMVAFTVVFTTPIVKNDVLPILPLLHGRKTKELLERARFVYVRGGFWQYIDQDWLIRVGKDASCALYAPEIDFWTLVRVVHMNYIEWRGEESRVFQVKGIHFGKADKGSVTVHTLLDRDMEKWITGHGGMVRDLED